MISKISRCTSVLLIIFDCRNEMLMLFQARNKDKLLERQASHADTARPFLYALAHSHLHDDGQVKNFLELLERYSRGHYMMAPLEFSFDHPVEEVGR